MQLKIVSIATVVVISMAATSFAQSKKGFAFIERPAEKQIDILFHGKLFTSYCYYDSVMKPVLYPIKTVSGITVTRGYPLNPVPGERVDHPHHIGLWLNYESVNGLDFWNNSTAIKYERRPRYGTIYHDKLIEKSASKSDASLTVTAQWKNKTNETLLTEKTQYNFQVSGSDFIIDRETTLKAEVEEVFFKDIKDGFLAVRVARELELPGKGEVKVVSSKGTGPEVITDHSKATATYLSSENLTGNEVWGTRAKWVTLKGTKDGKDVSITIIDHPENPGYPSYWHARDYGLFAVNPLGQEVFSKGKEKLNLTLKKDESVTFRYRVVIHEGAPLTTDQINAMSAAFSKTK